MIAKYPGKCTGCSMKIHPGTEVFHYKGVGTWHAVCRPAYCPETDDDGYDALKDELITSGVWGNRKAAGRNPITGRSA